MGVSFSMVWFIYGVTHFPSSNSFFFLLEDIGVSLLLPNRTLNRFVCVCYNILVSIIICYRCWEAYFVGLNHLATKQPIVCCLLDQH